MICELLFPSSILAVKLNRKTLVIVLEVEIYIYDISNMRLLHVIETTPNPEAIVALSPSTDNSYLAYSTPVPSPASLAQPNNGQPASSTTPAQTGDVVLFSTKTRTVANVIQAHKSPISYLAINQSGTMLATASDKGTVIRVWSIPGAEKLYQFRRGTREAKIYSINFNAVSTLLAVSSAHETVHIFKLGSQKSGSDKSQGPSSPEAGSIDSRDSSNGAGLEGGYEAFVDKKKNSTVSYVMIVSSMPILSSDFLSSNIRRRSLHLTKNLTSSVGGYLPSALTEVWEPSRDFAFLRLPTTGTRCVVALSGCVIASFSEI
jgi:autophagy-related protein 18